MIMMAITLHYWCPLHRSIFSPVCTKWHCVNLSTKQDRDNDGDDMSQQPLNSPLWKKTNHDMICFSGSSALGFTIKNLENVQIDALDLLVLLYYYLYYCITNCITVLLLVNTCQYLFVLLHLNSWYLILNWCEISVKYLTKIIVRYMDDFLKYVVIITKR